jgi:hypothetical protein
VVTGGFRVSRARPASASFSRNRVGRCLPDTAGEVARPLTPLSPPSRRQRLLAMPCARRPRPPPPSSREERWLSTTRGAFPRQGALPRPFPCHRDTLAPRRGSLRPFTLRGFLPAGLGPVRPPQPQPQVAFLDPTPLDDFCFQHERHGHADERLLLARLAISRHPLPRATSAASGCERYENGALAPRRPEASPAPAGRPQASLRAAAQ